MTSPSEGAEHTEPFQQPSRTPLFIFVYGMMGNLTAAETNWHPCAVSQPRQAKQGRAECVCVFTPFLGFWQAWVGGRMERMARLWAKFAVPWAIMVRLCLKSTQDIIGGNSLTCLSAVITSLSSILNQVLSLTASCVQHVCSAALVPMRHVNFHSVFNLFQRPINLSTSSLNGTYSNTLHFLLQSVAWLIFAQYLFNVSDI